MSTIKVSIILPVYNVEKYLNKCMESLVNQTLREIEIIAINDGSPDRSIDILETYGKKYPEKVFVHSIQNRGVSYARNLGLEYARGEYVLFVDSDDYVEENMCELLYNKAVADNNDLVICSRYNIRTLKDGSISRRLVDNLPMDQNFNVRDNKFENINISPFPWDKLFKRSSLNNIKFEEDIRFEDFLFIHTLLPNLTNIGVVREPLYNYRKENTGGFLNSFSEATFDIIRVFKKLIAYYKEHQIFEHYFDELEYLCIHHFYLRHAYFFKPVKHKGKQELQKKLVDEIVQFLEENFSDWRNNHYLKYSAPAELKNNYEYFFNKRKIKRYILAKQIMPLKVMKLYDFVCKVYWRLKEYSLSELYRMRKSFLKELKLHLKA